MPNQGKKQTVFQIKMVKIYAFFSRPNSLKNHILVPCGVESRGRTYRYSKSWSLEQI